MVACVNTVGAYVFVGPVVCGSETGGLAEFPEIEGTSDLLPDYGPPVGAIVEVLKSRWGHENSDPAKVAQVVFRLAASESLPAHHCWAVTPFSTLAKPRRRWREVSVSTDADTLRSVPALRF